MDKFTSRVDLFETIIWTPPMGSARLADQVAAIVEAISIDNECASFRDLARALDTYGASLTLNPGATAERDTWTLRIRKDTWFDARVQELA